MILRTTELYEGAFTYTNEVIRQLFCLIPNYQLLC